MNILSYIIIVQLGTYIHGQFIRPPPNLDEYDAYGSLLAMNEYLVVLAQNDQEQFTIVTYPFTNQSNKCVLPYDSAQGSISSLTRFVYNVAIGTKQNASQLIFSYINENWHRDVFLTVVFLEFMTNGCVQMINRTAINMTDLNMQEHAIVGMDPYGERAYAIGTYYIQCVEISSGNRWTINTEELFFPKSSVVTEDHQIFVVGQRYVNLKFLPYLYVLNLTSLANVTISSTIELSNFNFGSSAIDFTRDSTMSIALVDEVQWFVVGIPRLDMFLILSRELSILRKHISSQRGIDFGKSVAILDKNTFAVLAYKLQTPPWSTSQVQIYSLNSEESDTQPIIIYPNNQQVLPTVNSIPPPHSILTLVSWKSHLGLVVDVGAALLISASSPGYYSGQINDNISDMDIYISVPCLPGTARNTTSFGPCFLCPAGTKNSGTSGMVCEPCIANDTFLCLRGSSGEIPFINITSYNQSISYPKSPELVAYDDILLDHIFSFMGAPSHCLLISPLFWTILAIGIGLSIFILMCILMCFPQWESKRTFLKRVFQHLDLIGEGEIWFGGLMFFAIVVLLIFTIKLSVSFSHLYPIETIALDSKTTTNCDRIYPNSKFSSMLQLLSMTKHEDEDPMFSMLDEQNVTLTVHLIGTSFPCESVTTRQNLDRGKKIRLNNLVCSYDRNLSILSLSTILPEHLITLQFDLIGPYFVGAIRLCFSAPSDTRDEEKYTLQQLEFCQLFYVNNQTLTMNPIFAVKMTKIVNETAGFTVADDNTFSGRWIPSLTIDTLTDTLLFNDNGEYIRYLFDRFTLLIEITESEFFVKNIQEPIARHTEIVLHTILFSSIIIIDCEIISSSLF
ncbi:unnamed protein product [Adineta ricciae]|uniref:Uncharacterized protein n=1 Tax=Adineta ricciae TaxID=249248 RepID=A0A814KKW8_ADIRI|nr:unnamed protein product [Adineta ricciae]